jgi:hypothetical protein
MPNLETAAKQLLNNRNLAVQYWLNAHQKGKIKKYNKFGVFKADIVEKEVRVKTIINGKIETENTAKPGDYILTGSKNEKYVLTADKLKDRYVPIPGEDGKYKAVGTCYGVKYLGNSFTFKAPWGETMVCKNGDMIVSTHHNPNLAKKDIYRIEANAFKATYK